MSRAGRGISFAQTFIYSDMGDKKVINGSASTQPPVIVTVDCRRMTQSPVRQSAHDLINDPVFDDTDLVLQQVIRLLVSEKQKRQA